MEEGVQRLFIWARNSSSHIVAFMHIWDPPSAKKVVTSMASEVPDIKANLAACDIASSVTFPILHPQYRTVKQVFHKNLKDQIWQLFLAR